MTARLTAISIDANNPVALASFWSTLLNQKSPFHLHFPPTDRQKTGPNQAHFDLTSTSPGDQQQTVARALELGARHIDIGQRPEEGHVVLADPEGNEFCVIGPGNRFLANTGFIGALACDGSQEVGYFWAKALNWPLVWDENQETAIQSPEGGPKITWGGPPPNPHTAKNRVRFNLTTDGDQNAEVARLISLGATHRGTTADKILMADPDTNHFEIHGGVAP